MSTGPNMATITASLERSLQDCSLNHHRDCSNNTNTNGFIPTERSDSSENHPSDATLDLNSDVSLPYHWEQCLDLKTGEVYYINWRTGMKMKEDPRTNVELYNGECYSEDESASYDSEGSSSEESSVSCTRVEEHSHIGSSSSAASGSGWKTTAAAPVLVVAGCKSCLMYFMVPKEVEDCPKCCGQLLHFDKN